MYNFEYFNIFKNYQILQVVSQKHLFSLNSLVDSNRFRVSFCYIKIHSKNSTSEEINTETNVSDHSNLIIH